MVVDSPAWPLRARPTWEAQRVPQLTVTVAVASSMRDADPVGRFAEPMRANWPGPSPAPDFRAVALDSLLLTLQSADEGGSLTAHLSPLLVILDAEQSPAALAQLVDRLQHLLIPAVLLLPTLDGAARRLQRGGIILQPHDVAPATLAALIMALGERQSTIVELSRELAIHTRFETGMRGEMDRIHDELNLAATVQREMLPRRLPAVEGVQVGVLFRPAGYVSGDIYDVVQLDQEHLGFFVADAVGHGVPAALMTMVITRSLRMTHAHERTGAIEIVPPAEAMTRLNDELCRGQPEHSPRFSTAVYGVLNVRTREVRLVGAGHPPPIRVRAAGSTHDLDRAVRLDRLPTDGPLLGVFPGERYEEISLRLEPGETLLLYSDGFETAFAPPDTGSPASAHRRKSSELYLEELAALPWPGAFGSPMEALNQLARRIDEQAGSLHQIDDVTALAISVAAPASGASAGHDARPELRSIASAA